MTAAELMKRWDSQLKKNAIKWFFCVVLFMAIYAALVFFVVFKVAQ